ncbi:UNVERIFIED_CONTAM: putative ethanolamine kinase [Sesamum radiatum]|uniref:ethanolamine kinase n=1 Tax=Sesamum radiatum TaxID=300843 RepID=A0AAW2TG08_SESRA
MSYFYGYEMFQKLANDRFSGFRNRLLACLANIWNNKCLSCLLPCLCNSDSGNDSDLTYSTIMCVIWKQKVINWELCKDLFKQWSKLDESDFSLETVSGGITNLLLKVSVRENEESVVSMTVRLYGPNTEYVINRERELQVTDEELEALHAETNTYMLASHLYWALWALIQAKMSPIDFDYLGYFFLRYNEYKKRKEESFLLAQSYLSVPQAG